MMITDARNDTIVQLTESPPIFIEIEKFAPSYDLSEVSVDETQQSHSDQDVKPSTALIMNQLPNTSDASKVSLKETSHLVISTNTNQAFHDVTDSPSKQQSTFNGDFLRSRINTADSGRSQNSFRSLLGDRRRRAVHPCLPASEIVVGAIVGESDLIITSEAEANMTFSTRRKRSIVKQGMRKVSILVRDLVRCIHLLSKPFQGFGAKTEEVVLVRAEGRLT